MKKYIALVLALVCVLGLVGCNNKTVNIDLPFEVDNIENIEMYHFVGAPVSAEKKVIVAEETIENLYNMFEGLSLELKEVEETTGAEITSFRFNLSDGTSYELIYGCYGVKKGNLKSSTGNFEYFTSADIGSYWSNIDIDTVAVEESELPQYPLSVKDTNKLIYGSTHDPNADNSEYAVSGEGEPLAPTE